MKTKVLRKLISAVLLSAFLVLPVADGLAHGDCGIDNRSLSYARSPEGSFLSILSISTKPICNDCCPLEKNEQAMHCAVCLLHAQVLVNYDFPRIQLTSTPFANLTGPFLLVEPVFVIYEPPKS